MHEDQATLKSIARALDMHVSSVSRALSGSNQVSKATRERVNAEAKRQGYAPDPMLSALAQYRRKSRQARFRANVAWVTAFPRREGWRDLPVAPKYREGAWQRASDLGYGLIDHWLDPSIPPKRHLGILRAQGIVGLLIAPLPAETRSISLPLDAFTCVALGPTLEVPRTHRALNDVFDNVRVCLDQIALRGYRKPGMVISTQTDEATRHLMRSAFLGQETGGRRNQFADIHFFKEPDLRQFETFLDSRKPDVLVCCANGRTLDWLENIGLKVPGDLGLVTVNVPPGQHHLSGQTEHPEEAGAAAADLLVATWQAGDRTAAHPRNLYIEGTWQAGSTLG